MPPTTYSGNQKQLLIYPKRRWYTSMNSELVGGFNPNPSEKNMRARQIGAIISPKVSGRKFQNKKKIDMKRPNPDKDCPKDQLHP